MTAESSLCARPLTPRATCRACIAACPRDAIRISSEVVITEDCDGCGLCVAACPNGVFDWRWGLEEDLVARVCRQGRRAVVACEAVPEAATKVPCLGVVTETVLLNAVLQWV